MALLPFIPDYPASLSKAPKVLEVKFGNGYVSSVKDGINNIVQNWELTFSYMCDADALILEAFFDNLAGTTPFDWTPPGKSAGRYVCKEYARSHVAEDNNTITAKVEQRYGV
jgi:phage-related protein